MLHRLLTTCRLSALIFALALIAPTTWAQKAASKAAPKPRVWIDMDYGPFMSLTLEAPKPQGNIAYKGIVVPLKPDRSAAMVFFSTLAWAWRRCRSQCSF